MLDPAPGLASLDLDAWPAPGIMDDLCWGDCILDDGGIPLVEDWGALCNDVCDPPEVEFSLILFNADGDGKLVSLLKLTELSLTELTERPELNPLELLVLLPSPRWGGPLPGKYC